MAEHRKYDELAGKLRKDISLKLGQIFTRENMTSDSLADRYVEMGFKTHAQARGIISGLRRGGVLSLSRTAIGVPRSFSSLDLTHLAQIFHALNIGQNNELVENIKAYDSRFVYPPETTLEQREVINYSI